MTNQFAVPTFLSGANKDMATVDTYARRTSSTANNAASSFKRIQDSVTRVVKGSKIVTDSALFKSVSDKVEQLDTRAISDRLASIRAVTGKAADTFNTVKGLGSELQGSIYTASSIYSRASAEVNGIKSFFNRKNFISLDSAARAINDLSYTNFPLVLSDASTTIGVKSLMVQNAIGLKMPGAITAMTAGVTDQTELNGIVKDVGSGIVESSDIYALNEVANSKNCSHILMGQSPDILGDFAKKYTLPEGTPSSELPAIGNTMRDTYTKLDPEWNTCTRGNSVTPDLTIIASGSMDFKAAMRASDNTTEIEYFTGIGTTKQITETVLVATPASQNNTDQILQSLHLVSIRQYYDPERPITDDNHVWRWIGIRDDYFIYMNERKEQPEYYKVAMGAARTVTA